MSATSVAASDALEAHAVTMSNAVAAAAGNKAVTAAAAALAAAIARARHLGHASLDAMWSGNLPSAVAPAAEYIRALVSASEGAEGNMEGCGRRPAVPLMVARRSGKSLVQFG